MSIRQSKSEKKCTIFVQPTLKKTRTKNSPLEPVDEAGTEEMEKDDIVNVREPTASSIVSKGERSTVGKLFKDMAPLCSIYDVDFGYLAGSTSLKSERF